MKTNWITGAADQARPDINVLRVHPVDITASVVHDTSGIRRRTRRKMDRLAKKMQKYPSYAAAQSQVDEAKAEAGL